MKDFNVPIQSLIDHIKTATDVDPWAKEMAEELLKEQETSNLYKCPNCGTWVSAENVVRCKDCKKRYKKLCGYFYADGRIMCDDWFCADGERKDS